MILFSLFVKPGLNNQSILVTIFILKRCEFQATHVKIIGSCEHESWEICRNGDLPKQISSLVARAESLGLSQAMWSTSRSIF
ncbi:hypothetical protein A9Q84_15555 [Halobacteriovorax marinus]|uniref:Uncharacterized protein n=1 Tax=Halobacteriovorax marinus TaxID=97084 RepID=A0A1Y5F3W8_9BACT|nr:hypothetical protein A9Q84_15555 [Halobacteriovorax marinus]